MRESGSPVHVARGLLVAPVFCDDAVSYYVPAGDGAVATTRVPSVTGTPAASFTVSRQGDSIEVIPAGEEVRGTVVTPGRDDARLPITLDTS